MSKLLVAFKGDAQRVALLEDDRLVAYHQARSALGPQVEDVYLGKANRVMKALGAVFVRLQDKEEGFLPFDEIPGGQVPRPGDSLLVQVKKPRIGDKAPYLTANIALPGRLALLLPFDQGWRISRRIKDEEARQRLSALGKRLCPAGMGLVLRDEAAQAQDQDIQDEVQALLERWQDLQSRSQGLTAPAPVASAPDLLTRLLREAKEPVESIVTDDEALAAPLGLPVHYAQDPMQLYNVPRLLRRALRRRVLMDSGASLVIDPCEALTVIDVNSAQKVHGKDRERTLLETNLEAAREIARLLRLRRIGGIVLIDFIDMQTQADRDAVQAELQQALQKDPNKCVIHGFTRLGMLEMTRKKNDEALEARRLKPCPHCGGTGQREDDPLDET